MFYPDIDATTAKGSLGKFGDLVMDTLTNQKKLYYLELWLRHHINAKSVTVGSYKEVKTYVEDN